MNHFKQFLVQALDNGMSVEGAIASPEARAAAKRDDVAYREQHSKATKNEFLARFQQARAKAGSRNQGFEDQEEMMSAMSDLLYEQSEEYRAAVAEILSHTPAEVCGVSATATAGDGTRIQIGRGLQTEVATKERMLESAYRDMILEGLGKLDLGTAKGRYEYLQYLADPKNAWLVEYQESLLTSDSQRTHQAMLDSKASGHVDRIEIKGEANDGSVPQGSFGQGGENS
jgi:hypothetical protein